MSVIEHARSELLRTNMDPDDSAVLLDIMRLFFDQWDSSGAVSVMVPIMTRLLAGQPLSPLTGADDEWYDPMGDGRMLQNVRCSSVFRMMDGADYHHHDIDNPAWDGTFPYDPPTRMPAAPVMEVETNG